MEWKNLDMVKLEQLRSAITIRINQYEGREGRPIDCPLCEIYDTDDMVEDCQGCPANVQVRRPDSKKRESICNIYCKSFDDKTMLKFLKEQRDRIDIEMHDRQLADTFIRRD